MLSGREGMNSLQKTVAIINNSSCDFIYTYNSFLNQDFDDYEIIAVDDGSTNKSAKSNYIFLKYWSILIFGLPATKPLA